MTIKYALMVGVVLAALACEQAPAASPTQDVPTPTTAPLPTSSPIPTESVPGPAHSPTAIPAPVDPAARKALENVIRDPMARIADRVPGFGGVFRDPRTNTVYIYLQDASRLEDAKRVLLEMFGADFFEGSKVEALEGEYSMAHLANWYGALDDVIWQVEGVVMTGLDERMNRIQIDMQPRRGAREEMEAAIASVGVPRAAVVIDVGCSGVEPWPLDYGDPPAETFLRAVDYSVEVADQASYGETIRMKLTLRNVSEEPVSFYTGGRPPHDFVVSTPDGEQVWHWMCGKIILAPLDSRNLEPGEEMEFTGEWEQVDNRGEPVLSGTYLVRGVLVMEYPEMLVTEEHEVVIIR